MKPQHTLLACAACGTLMLTLAGCLQPPVPVVANLPPIRCPVPHPVDLACPRPAVPTRPLTAAELEDFSLAQEAALSECESRRSKAVTATRLCEAAANKR
jgi:hypothetical protein